MSDIKRILICEDSIIVRERLKEALDSYNEFEIIEAVNGSEAVQIYKENPPFLCFLNITKMEKNGIEVLRDIKEVDNNAKVVMVSSIGNRINLKASLEAGALDFIQKPVEEELVEEILDRILQGDDN